MISVLISSNSIFIGTQQTWLVLKEDFSFSFNYCEKISLRKSAGAKTDISSSVTKLHARTDKTDFVI